MELAPSAPEGCPSSAIWLANEFSCCRYRYLVITHEATLFSAVLYGKGVNDIGGFVEGASRAIGLTAKELGVEAIYSRFFADELSSVSFAKIDSKPALGSMNDIARCAKFMLAPGERSPLDVSCSLNEMPMSMLGMGYPFDAFKKLAGFTLIDRARHKAH